MMFRLLEGETVRIQFDSDNDLKAGLHEIFTNFYSFEMTPYGVFELQKETVERLKEQGIAFHEMRVVITRGLSRSEICELKTETPHIIFVRL